MERNLNFKMAFLLVSFIFCLNACTYNPFSSTNEFTGNPVGPIIGGAAGAGITAALGAPKLLVGLAGLGGAGLGYYLTTLRFASGGIIQGGGQVFTQGQYLSINVPSDRLFDVNTAEFLPEAQPILNSIVAVLCRYPCSNILISGNMSGFGTARFERRLSEARARQVASYLWANGIMSVSGDHFHTRKLTYVGYGNYFPIADTIHCCSFRQNSRIQITAYPSSAQLYMDKAMKTFGNIGALDDCT